MLFLYWPNTILPYKMAAVEQETYGNKLAPHGVYTAVPLAGRIFVLVETSNLQSQL